MIGRSIYISQYAENMALDERCDFYFTSLHIAEEFNDDYKEKVDALLKKLEAAGKKIIVDLSPRGLEILGFKSIEELAKKYRIDYIRYDFGFKEDEIVAYSRYCGTAVNASTCNIDLLDKLQGDVIAIHNFYPRKETGLDREYYEERNELFKNRGIKVGTFICGDKDFRGPLFEGLPTLEEHRNKKPYIQYLDLRKESDLIIVGDAGLSDYEADLIYKTEKEGIIQVPAELNGYPCLYGRTFTNRIDSPSWLIRIKESREYATAGQTIEPTCCIERKRGSVTIDNLKYLRYSGEMQIIKKDLPEDEKVNVIGRVLEEYLEVIDHTKRNDRFCFVKGE